MQWKAVIGICIERETTTFQVDPAYNRARYKEIQGDYGATSLAETTPPIRSEDTVERVMPIDPRMPKNMVAGIIEAAVMRPLEHLGPMQRLAAYTTHQIAEADYIETHPQEVVLVARTRKHRLSKAAGISADLFKRRRYLRHAA